MKRITVLIAASALVSGLVSAAFASSSEEANQVVQASRSERIVGSVVIAESSSEARQTTSIDPRDNGPYRPDGYSYGSSGGCGWKFYNSMSWYVNLTKVHHLYAYSKRNSGSCQYKTNMHVALVKDVGGGVWDPVWNLFNKPCMTETDVNGTSDSCASPWEDVNSGDRWGSWGGFKFDVGNNGVWNGDCSGCIDITKQF